MGYARESEEEAAGSYRFRIGQEMAMTNIIRSKDCGNSSKNKLVEDLAIALSTNDHSTLSALVTDDVEWNIIGNKVLHGRAAVLQALQVVIYTDSDPRNAQR
jgi:hypothetical protein